MSGNKKVKELMSECKISRNKRNGLPILCFGDNIIWVPTCRVGEKVSAFEGEAVLLTLFPKDEE
jgi:tRNA(Ile)-lysidine synthase